MSGRFESIATSLFSTLETCDRCGVRAQVRVVLDTGGQLYFCGHHANEHRDALERVAVTVGTIHA